MKLSKVVHRGPQQKPAEPVQKPEVRPEPKPISESIFRTPGVEKSLESSIPQGQTSQIARLPVAPAKIEPVAAPVQDLTAAVHDYPKQKEKATELYKELVKFARGATALGGGGDIVDLRAKAGIIVKTIVDELVRENDGLLVLTGKTTNDNHIFSHLANTCILALRLGLGLSYPKEKIMFLGVSALLHEAFSTHIDLTRGLIKQKDNVRLTKEIYDKIQAKDFAGAAFSPKELSEMAKLISLVDIYESLSHPRKLRERKLPHEVLKMFIQASDEVFEHSIVKKFIEEISIYPPGSYVRLNSGQIGQVVRVNRRFPTRPIVEILFDRDGIYLEKPEYVDLLENAMMQISDAVDEDKLSGLDKKGLMEISMHKWWTE